MRIVARQFRYVVVAEVLPKKIAGRGPRAPYFMGAEIDVKTPALSGAKRRILLLRAVFGSARIRPFASAQKRRLER